MNATKKGNIYLTWTLRILLMVMIVLFAMFSMDVFEEGKEFWDTTVALLIHNIPSFVMIIILIIAWKREDIGGILLILSVSSFAIYIFSGSGNFMYGTLIMLGIPFLIGALFVINYYLFGKERDHHTQPDS